MDKTKNTLGDTCEVTFVSLGNKTVEAKVDTGADISSLHADQIAINEGTKKVTFISKALSNDTKFTVPLVEYQAVTSADGGLKYRPVISLAINIGGKSLENILFNLNDRNEMKYPVLVGQNILEKGKFIVDPTLENILEPVCADQPTNVTLQIEPPPVSPENTPDKNTEANQALAYILNNKLSLDDVLIAAYKFYTSPKPGHE